MKNLPEHLKYAATHEWVRLEDDGTVRVGITDHAQEELGDLVYVELPELGRQLSAREECAVVESVKAASDLYSPVSGEIIAVNETVVDSPEMVNEDAYGAWLFSIRLTDRGELNELLDAEAYAESLGD